MKNEVVVHPLAGKLRATLQAYSTFSERRHPDEEGGGRKGHRWWWETQIGTELTNPHY